MKRFNYFIPIILIFISCISKLSNSMTVEAPSTIYYNGKIITMETDDVTYVESLVEKDGKIAFVGNQKISEKRYPNATKINLRGHTLLPGFIDPHSHFGMISNTLSQVDLNPEPVGEVRGISDILRLLQAYKVNNEIPDGEWIYGWGYDDGQLVENRHPYKDELDSILPNNPVYLQHTSGHMGVGNSLALKQFNITSSTPNPDGGSIEKYPDTKEPTGLVQETAMYPFVELMLKNMAKNQIKHFDATQDVYASNGITTAHDGMTDRTSIEFFRSQAAKGKLKIDLIALGGFAEIDQNIADTTCQFKSYKNHFKVQGTKIIADGSPQGKTAYFTSPYLTNVPGCTQDCRGLPSLSQAQLNELFLTGYKHNNQLFIHCNGDASIDMILNAHEYACEELGQAFNKDRRTIPIHAQFARIDQLRKFKEFNMEPSFFTNHAYFWGDVHMQNLGEPRASFLSPMNTANSLGLKPTNHSDATDTPLNPLLTVWSAVNRISRSNQVIGKEEKISPYQALQAITINAAYEFFEENRKGSLEVGKLADLVILERNPLTISPIEIKDIKILQTIKEGKSVYSSTLD